MLNQAFHTRALGFALLASAAVIGQSATAREAGGFAQAEWAQDYASPAAMQVQRSSTPILSPQTVAATEQMIERYRDIVNRGGWKPVSGADGTMPNVTSAPPCAAGSAARQVSGPASAAQVSASATSCSITAGAL